MKQHICKLVENRNLWDHVPLLVFEAPELARMIQPGQFVLVRDPSTFDPYLRQTAWLYRVEGDRLSLVLSSGNSLSGRVSPGHLLDLLGPAGRTAEFVKSARHVLLIGEDEQIAPLVAMAHAALESLERSVVLLNRSRQAAGAETGPLPAYLLSPEIEYRVVPTTQSLPEILGPDLIAWADQIVASGSPELYAAVGQAVRTARFRLEPGWVHVLMDLPMPCGVGTCYACAVGTAHGPKLACVDGPWFDWVDLERQNRGWSRWVR